jgi:glutaredoxin
MREQLIITAKQIVDLGITEPDLFVAMALFEEGFGPDRISDMTTNIILRDLLIFSRRVLQTLTVPCQPMTITLRNGKYYDAYLPVNPFVKGGAPVILVPNDILRDLPIAADWSDVASAAAKNAMFRQSVNDQVAMIWEAKSRKSKGDIRRWALSSKDGFETLLGMIHGASPKPYDMAADPLGEIVWRKVAATIAQQEPLTLKPPPSMDLAGVCSVVDQIIEQFRFLIEDRRISEELYHAGKPRPEKSAQRLFFAVAHAYCKANNLDLTPEADTGNGPVDFKVSAGFTGRVLVEIKLSTNGKVVNGYTRQLETYKIAEQTTQGYYVVIDVGQMGEKDKKLIEVKNAATARGEITSPIIFIDGSRRLSASKL